MIATRRQSNKNSFYFVGNDYPSLLISISFADSETSAAEATDAGAGESRDVLVCLVAVAAAGA